MKTLEDLGQFYSTVLLPDLRGLEAERAVVQKNIRRLGIGAAAATAIIADLLFGHYPRAATTELGFAGFILKFYNLAGFAASLIAGLGLPAAAAAFLYRRFTAGYFADFKSKVIPKILAFIDPNLQYAKDGSVGEAVFASSMLFNKWPNIYSGEDYVSGKIGDTPIQFSEIDAKHQETDPDGTIRTRPIFKGIFFAADFNRNLKGRTFVLSDMAKHLLGEFYGQALQALEHGGYGELVKLENPDFARQFVVYSTSQIEARCILTPAFMQNLAKYSGMNGETLSMSFIGNKIYAAFPKLGDPFAPRIFGSLLEFGQVVKYYERLKVLTRIVDDLHLDVRLWTGQ